jgi:hypothetical protein
MSHLTSSSVETGPSLSGFPTRSGLTSGMSLKKPIDVILLQERTAAG